MIINFFSCLLSIYKYDDCCFEDPYCSMKLEKNARKSCLVVLLTLTQPVRYMEELKSVCLQMFPHLMLLSH